MKTLILRTAAALLFAAGASSAFAGTLITFNGTAPAGSYAPHVQDVFTIAGFSFQSTAGNQFSLSPDYDPGNAPPDDSDFETFEGGPSWTMSAAAPFALTSFLAAAIYDDAGGTLTLTGHVSGGGTVTQVFNLPAYTSQANWNTYTLPGGWTNLTSVDFVYSGTYVGMDNISINNGIGTVAPVPTLSPAMLVVMLLALAGFAGAAVRRRAESSVR